MLLFKTKYIKNSTFLIKIFNRFRGERMINKFLTFLKLIYYLLRSKNCSNKVTFLSKKDTINESIKNKKTIIRFGDGEFNFLNGKGVHYQSYNVELAREIGKIVDDYINNNCNFLLCMPADFLLASRKNILRHNYFFSWPFTRYFFKKKFNIKNIIYGDSFIFAKNQAINYERIWMNSDINHIVFVNSNKENYNKFKININVKCDFVEIDSKNSYDKISLIMTEILNKNIGEKSVVLVSAGPCAKAICYRLSKLGIYSVDTGHCWDQPLYEIKK